MIYDELAQCGSVMANRVVVPGRRLLEDRQEDHPQDYAEKQSVETSCKAMHVFLHCEHDGRSR